MPALQPLGGLTSDGTAPAVTSYCHSGTGYAASEPAPGRYIWRDAKICREYCATKNVG